MVARLEIIGLGARQGRPTQDAIDHPDVVRKPIPGDLLDPPIDPFENLQTGRDAKADLDDEDRQQRRRKESSSLMIGVFFSAAGALWRLRRIASPVTGNRMLATPLTRHAIPSAGSRRAIVRSPTVFAEITVAATMVARRAPLPPWAPAACGGYRRVGSF
jgi:hypothetical protein